MKKYLISLLVVTFALGCGRPAARQKAVLAKINNYEINTEEFEEEFKTSIFGRTDTLQSRQEFLDNLITRKLILQDAQARGLDKEKSFLKAIQAFWEQSLLKLAIERKSKEIVGSVFISDKAVEDAYKKMVADGKTDKTYEEMYSQIKWQLIRLAESQMMNRWIAELRRKADVKVNKALLENKAK